MLDSLAARGEILRRIRAATGSAPDVAAIEAEWSAITRGYRGDTGEQRDEVLEQLEDRLRDYDAGVYRCGAADVGEWVTKLLTERGRRRMAFPSGVPLDWRVGSVEFVEDTRGDVSEIDACDGVLTSATLAIAETGTIVLQDVPGQGRRAVTLLPDYHLCVVDAASVVRSVPEAVAILQATAAKSTTFFSGPSATADIEMTRIKGVHGPRFVDVILVV